MKLDQIPSSVRAQLTDKYGAVGVASGLNERAINVNETVVDLVNQISYNVKGNRLGNLISVVSVTPLLNQLNG